LVFSLCLLASFRSWSMTRRMTLGAAGVVLLVLHLAASNAN
jgi:hypothetical protein